ncbi:hypothetical protein CsSME_00018523 [Camellia sinensis var. sinensis]
MSIRNVSHKDKSIQEFYNEMTTYWDQLALMEPSDFWLLDSYTKYREKQRLVQFLMALCDQFEPLWGVILHRFPLPSVDGAIRKLIAEETQFKVAHGASASQLLVSPSLGFPWMNAASVVSEVIRNMRVLNFCSPRVVRLVHHPLSCHLWDLAHLPLFFAPASENESSSNMQSMFEQFKSFMDRVSKRQIGIVRRFRELYILDSLLGHLSSDGLRIQFTWFEEFLATHGTIHQSSCSVTPA